MFTKEDARMGVGIIGNIISLVLFLSPLPTFYTIWKKKSVEQYSPIPYLATFINCGLWVLYGLPLVHPHSTLVITINGSGFVIEIVYLAMFLIFSDPKKRLRLVAVVAVECIILAALAVLALTLAHTTKLRSSIVGSICMAGNILMYAAPLSVMKLVIQSKSVEFMPFLLSFFSLLNGICWSTYSVIRFDPNILVPNGMGTVLAIAQLILYATYFKNTKRILAERKAKGEMGMVEKPASGVTKQNGHC